MKPLWIVYNNKLLGGDTLGIIFKNGDGRRNEKTGWREVWEGGYEREKRVGGGVEILQGHDDEGLKSLSIFNHFLQLENR